MNITRLDDPPDTVQITFAAQDALPKRKRILEVMGYVETEPPGHVIAAVDLALAQAETLMRICGGYRVFETFELSGDHQHSLIGGILFDTGKIIGVQFRRVSQAAIFLCTIGDGMETLARRLMKEGDYLAGFAVDIVASEAVELAMDRIQAHLEEEQKRCGLGISNRYSPGYCGWNVAEQKKLFSLLPNGFCGVSLNDSCLMTPIKSVSGIIGIGAQVKRVGYACRFCDMKDCIYRSRLEPANGVAPATDER